jgi:hypothetical protein
VILVPVLLAFVRERDERESESRAEFAVRVVRGGLATLGELPAHVGDDLGVIVHRMRVGAAARGRHRTRG